MKIQELVRDLNQTDTYCCDKSVSLLTATDHLSRFNVGALAVVNDEYNVIGIISERDIVRSIANRQKDFFSGEVADEMTTEVLTCSTGDDVQDVYRLLIAKKIRHVPVVENGELIAMLSIRNFDGVMTGKVH